MKELAVTGPFNIQFLVKDNKPFVIEVNLRASRTFPLLSKAMDANFPEVAVDSFSVGLKSLTLNIRKGGGKVAPILLCSITWS